MPAPVISILMCNLTFETVFFFLNVHFFLYIAYFHNMPFVGTFLQWSAVKASGPLGLVQGIVPTIAFQYAQYLKLYA